MTQPTNTYSTYDAIGNREDLSDIIYDVTPTETPVLSMIPKTDATATKHEWLTRSLAAASGNNFVVEGDDATNDAANANVRLYNYCGLSDKVAVVSTTQEAVKKAGTRSSMALEMRDKMKELKKDIETAMLQNVAWVAGNDTLARKVGGLQAYVKTNTSIASDAVASAGTGADIHTDGTARALDESMVETVLALAWANGGNPTIGAMNAFQKRKFATFSGNATRTSNGDSKKVVNSVDIYIDPLGNEVRLVPCRQCPTDVVFFIDPDYFKFATLQGFRTEDLAKVGHSDRKMISAEWTTEICNEKAHAGVYDLTAS